MDTLSVAAPAIAGALVSVFGYIYARMIVRDARASSDKTGARLGE